MRYLRPASAGVIVLLVLIMLFVAGCGNSSETDSVSNTGGSGISVLLFTAPG
ncbi:MAG: hypothetical protein JW738_04630 [Actinobacteria bacterium]|nr:hypothetical protein [Actinomycetota bacterium]